MTKAKRELMDAKAMDRALHGVAAAFLKRHSESLPLCALVGIRTRGVFLARRLQAKIKTISDQSLPLGILDITLYRDDLTMIGPNPVVKSTAIQFPMDGKLILLVDDVLFTGRTIRAALDELVDFGRPKKIELAVLIDRGRRELPIMADYAGLTLETTAQDNVHVMCRELENEDKVVLETLEPRFVAGKEKKR